MMNPGYAVIWFIWAVTLTLVFFLVYAAMSHRDRPSVFYGTAILIALVVYPAYRLTEGIIEIMRFLG